MAQVGKLIRFDDSRGYGFIASEGGGGEDVFVHANDFGDDRHRVYPGIRVEYEVEQGDRGLKAASVHIVDGQRTQGTRRTVAGTATPSSSAEEDDGMCDVLLGKQLTAEVTELLLQHVPTLTAAQVVLIRERLVTHAASHGWIDS